MTCCRCNRTGSCKNCSCSKRKLKCTNCLLDKCTNIEQNTDQEEPSDTASSDQTSELEVSTESGTRNDTHRCQRTLPDPLPVSDPSFSWGSSDSSTFTAQINEAYDEVVGCALEDEPLFSSFRIKWKTLCRRSSKAIPIFCNLLRFGEYCSSSATEGQSPPKLP